MATKAPKVREAKPGEVLFDMDGFKERLRAEARRLERFGAMGADFSERSDGRASGVDLAASFVAEFVIDPDKKD